MTMPGSLLLQELRGVMCPVPMDARASISSTAAAQGLRPREGRWGEESPVLALPAWFAGGVFVLLGHLSSAGTLAQLHLAVRPP